MSIEYVPNIIHMSKIKKSICKTRQNSPKSNKIIPGCTAFTPSKYFYGKVCGTCGISNIYHDLFWTQPDAVPNWDRPCGKFDAYINPCATLKLCTHCHKPQAPH